MSKKEAFIPLAFIALSIVFLIVSLMVFLSNGKSKKWVARKMRIGGLLLIITLVSCSNKPDKTYATCYMIVPNDDTMNEIIKYPEIKPKIEIEIDSKKVIYGNISEWKSENYSYQIVDEKGVTLQKANIITKRYAFDPDNKEFMIEINGKINAGKYLFKLYDCNHEEQDSTQLIHEQELIIKNKL